MPALIIHDHSAFIPVMITQSPSPKLWMGLSEPFDGERDAIYAQTLDDSSWTLGSPVKLAGLEWRYADLDFCESGPVERSNGKVRLFCTVVACHQHFSHCLLLLLVLVIIADGVNRKWILEANGNKKLLWERSWEDRYTAPGEPMTRRGARGKYFIVQPTPTSIYLQGAGASPLGDRPFLDRLDFGSEETTTTRLWRCAAPLEGDLDATKEVDGVIPSERKDVYESMVLLLPSDKMIP